MSVVFYVGIVRGKTVVAALGDAPCEDRDIIRIMPQPPARSEQKIFSNSLFTFLTTPELTYVAASPVQADRSKPIEFLATLSRQWAPSHASQSATAAPHALDGVLQSQFARQFAAVNQENRTAALAREMDETHQILTESVSKAFGRGEELQNISTKSENLKSISEEFRRQSTNLKWKMRCQYIKSWVLWILAILVVLFLLLSWVCGGYRLPRCL